MFIRRSKSIFQIEVRVLEPEERKLRLRRRVVFFACLVALVLAGIPVVRQLRPELDTAVFSRQLASILIESRNLASSNRVVVRLDFGEKLVRRLSGLADNCGDMNSSDVPPQVFDFPGADIRVRTGDLENQNLQSVRSICFHPLKGVFATGNESAPSVLVFVGPENDFASERFDRLHTILISDDGEKVIRNTSGLL